MTESGMGIKENDLIIKIGNVNLKKKRENCMEVDEIQSVGLSRGVSDKILGE